MPTANSRTEPRAPPLARQGQPQRPPTSATPHAGLPTQTTMDEPWTNNTKKEKLRGAREARDVAGNAVGFPPMPNRASGGRWRRAAACAVGERSSARCVLAPGPHLRPAISRVARRASASECAQGAWARWRYGGGSAGAPSALARPHGGAVAGSELGHHLPALQRLLHHRDGLAGVQPADGLRRAG